MPIKFPAANLNIYTNRPIFRIKFFWKKNSKKVEWLTWSGVHLKQFIEIDYSSNSNDNK